jgi:hypothetical protein
MAATGYTPILIYSSTTSGNVPTTGNLQAGELAINIPDGLLFFNQSGTISVLANSNVDNHLTWVGGTQQTLTVNSTGSFVVPVGNTAARPATPALGMLRFNSSTGTFEGYQTFAGAIIASLTNATTTATAVTVTNHGLSTGQTITVAGCTPSAYNGTFTVTVVSAATFTYTMLSDPGGAASVIGTYSYKNWGSISSGGNSGSGASAGGAVYENAQVIVSNYTMTTNYNGESVGAITVYPGVTVTIPSGSRWVIL